MTIKAPLHTILIILLLLTLVPITPVYSAVISLPEDHSQYKLVKGIYDTIARAFGEARLPPRLVVVPHGGSNGQLVAWSDAGSEGAIGVESGSGQLTEGYIAIEERVVQMFSSLGGERDNALAFLLAHELTHYYQRHGWVGDFGNAFASSDVGRKMIKAAAYEDVVKRETEADYFGGFYGYLAGYDTLGIAPRVLDLLYAGYRLPDKLPNYPSRAERKAIAERAAANLQKMIPVFESATRLLMLERYETAGRLFAHLAQTFPSREMFNNAGVAYALEALRTFRPGTLRFAYPFELDAETRLRTSRTGRGPNEAERRARLLQKAADCFEKAQQRDVSYSTAVLNAAAVQSLLGEQENALILARKGLRLAGEHNELLQRSQAFIISGIAHAQSDDTDKARADFTSAGPQKNPLAALNLAALNVKPANQITPTATESATTLTVKETIAGFSAWDTFVRGSGSLSYTLQGSTAGEEQLAIHCRNNGVWDQTLLVSGSSMLNTVAARQGYIGETARGIRIGSTLAEVRERYGVPARSMPLRQGSALVYPKTGIIFRIDAGALVSGWVLFAGG
jgi:tetratricopeptide (TPR) repeat protein